MAEPSPEKTKAPPGWRRQLYRRFRAVAITAAIVTGLWLVAKWVPLFPHKPECLGRGGKPIPGTMSAHYIEGFASGLGLYGVPYYRKGDRILLPLFPDSIALSASYETIHYLANPAYSNIWHDIPEYLKTRIRDIAHRQPETRFPGYIRDCVLVRGLVLKDWGQWRFAIDAP